MTTRKAVWIGVLGAVYAFVLAIALLGPGKPPREARAPQMDKPGERARRSDRADFQARPRFNPSEESFVL